VTDDEGNYRLAGLAAGRFTITPIARAFVVAANDTFKQPGQTANVAENESITKIDFALVRGGVITGRITGAQTGAVLAFVSSGILGQYDPFGPNGGELLLVYPNVIAVERQLRVPPADFRLWVCLHEVTHRVQFRANPWLADHMSQALAVLTEDAGENVGEVGSRPVHRPAMLAGTRVEGSEERAPVGDALHHR